MCEHGWQTKHEIDVDSRFTDPCINLRCKSLDKHIWNRWIIWWDDIIFLYYSSASWTRLSLLHLSSHLSYLLSFPSPTAIPLWSTLFCGFCIQEGVKIALSNARIRLHDISQIIKLIMGHQELEWELCTAICNLLSCTVCHRGRAMFLGN